MQLMDSQSVSHHCTGECSFHKCFAPLFRLSKLEYYGCQPVRQIVVEVVAYKKGDESSCFLHMQHPIMPQNIFDRQETRMQLEPHLL